MADFSPVEMRPPYPTPPHPTTPDNIATIETHSKPQSNAIHNALNYYPVLCKIFKKAADTKLQSQINQQTLQIWMS